MSLFLSKSEHDGTDFRKYDKGEKRKLSGNRCWLHWKANWFYGKEFLRI
jgi:hypothetical protein